jgi:plastocyanin
MRIIQSVLLLTAIIVSSSVAHSVLADDKMPATKIVEGKFADALYESQKDKAQILVQKDTKFTLQTQGKPDQDRPAEITAKVGEVFFIKNAEASIEHNVYDETDTSWVLEKQKPSTVAAVAFLKPGTHHFMCAIHPGMEVKVTVTQ